MFCLHSYLSIRRCFVWIPNYFCKAIRCRRTGYVCCCCETGEPGDWKSTIDGCVSSRLMRKSLLSKVPFQDMCVCSLVIDKRLLLRCQELKVEWCQGFVYLLFWKIDILSIWAVNGLSAALSLELFDPFFPIRMSVIWWLCLVLPWCAGWVVRYVCLLLEYRKRKREALHVLPVILFQQLLSAC